MRFRQSQLKKWMSCPLQAYFSEILQLPGKPGSKQTFGSVMHACLEQYNRTGNIDSALKLFRDAWEDPSVVGLPDIEVWNKYSTYGGLRERGLEILRSYDEQMRWEDRTIIAVEHRFLVPFGRHELTGTVDLLEVRKNFKGNDVLLVADYKTNTRRPSTAALALNIQFTDYVYATLQPEFWLGNGDDFPPLPNGEWYFETLKDLPRRALWVHLWDNAKELDAGGRDDEDFARLYRLCNEIERAIEHKVFVPNIGEACAICDYSSDPCPVEVPSRDSWETDRLEDANAWV